MEDRRTALALFLSILVVMVYSQLVIEPYQRRALQHQQTQKAVEESKPPGEHGADMALNHPESVNDGAPTGVSPTANAAPSKEDYEKSPATVIESERMILTLSHLGGRVTSLKLLGHREEIDKPELVNLVKVAEGEPFPLGLNVGNFSDAGVKYTRSGLPADVKVHDGRLRVPPDRQLALEFVGVLPNGIEVRKSFSFTHNSYLFEASFFLGTRSEGASAVSIDWHRYVSPIDPNIRMNPMGFSVLGSDNKLVTVLATPEVVARSTVGAARWIAIGDKYFMVAIVPALTGQNTLYGRDGDHYFMKGNGFDTSGKFTIYAGPKELKALGALGFGLERSVDLGYFSFLGRPLLSLLELLHRFLGNWGLSIILLTLLIKALFLPLSAASMKSMQAMQAIQPEMIALRERYRDDPTTLNREMMTLYKRRGVNPMGGCFPILIQIPVFIGLYNTLYTSIDLRHAPFALWINDLSAKERLVVLGVPLPVMILLMGASMFFQQLTTPSAADPTQKRIMLMMPIIFTGMFIVMPLPSGLVLYWLVNNVISIVQQFYLRPERKVSPLRATALGSLGIFFIGFILTLFGSH